MKRTLLFATLVLVLLAPAFAQDWAKGILEKSPRHGEWIDIKYGDRTVHSFVVYPERKDKAPVVIVIHEIFGMTDWVRTVADQLAANGYIAIAPDLVSGFGPKGGGSEAFPSIDDARGAVGKLNADIVTADLNAVADYAKKIKSANGKIAVTGYCWGGGQTFRFATNRADLSAAFVFYGPAPTTADMARIKAPIYGFYAGNDNRINASIPDATKDMKAAGKSYDPVIYDGAGHGFMRMGMDPTQDATKNAANVKAREDAWKRWLELLKKM